MNNTMEYSAKVMDHYEDPRNVGVVDDADRDGIDRRRAGQVGDHADFGFAARIGWGVLSGSRTASEQQEGCTEQDSVSGSLHPSLGCESRHVECPPHS